MTFSVTVSLKIRGKLMICVNPPATTQLLEAIPVGPHKIVVLERNKSGNISAAAALSSSVVVCMTAKLLLIPNVVSGHKI